MIYVKHYVELNHNTDQYKLFFIIIIIIIISAVERSLLDIDLSRRPPVSLYFPVYCDFLRCCTQVSPFIITCNKFTATRSRNHVHGTSEKTASVNYTHKSIPTYMNPHLDTTEGGVGGHHRSPFGMVQTWSKHIFWLVHVLQSFHTLTPIANTFDATFLDYVTNLVFLREYA